MYQLLNPTGFCFWTIFVETNWFIKLTRSLRQLAAPAPYGVRLPCGDHWTLPGPAHPSGGPYGASRRNDTPTSAELEY